MANKHYYKNAGYTILHRENDLPAIEYYDGAKLWYVNDKLHRENGPAIEYPDGSKSWWLNGKEISEEEHKKMTAKKTLSSDPSMKKDIGEMIVSLSKQKVSLEEKISILQKAYDLL